MNRFQITADIDVALLLGTLTEHQHGANKVKYAKLEELLKYLDKEVAGISPEFIYATVVPAIK